MRILNIVGSLDKSAGGPSRSVPQSCAQVSKLGVSIQLIARPSDDPVDIIATPEFQIRFLSIWNLFRYGISISKKDISLVHLQHVWDPYIHVMAWWARMKGIPYIITPRGMLEPWIMNHNPWKKKLGMLMYQKRDLKKALAIHATCQMEKETVRNLGFMNPVTIIPNGVNINKFPLEIPQKSDAPKKILFLSRIHQKKGIEFLIEAWSQLDKNLRKDWIIEIIGNGESNYIKNLQQKINHKDLQNEIVIKEPIFGEKKIKVFREASLFVLPTYSENFGIVVAEALVSYTPVITTVGTPWEELNTCHAGWWIEIGAKPLKEALTVALQTKDSEIIEMGKNGRQLIEDKYSIEAVGHAMKTFYQKIID